MILEQYKILSLLWGRLGPCWDHLAPDWSMAHVGAELAMQEVAQGLPQVTAPGSKPPGQEEHHLQSKGSISRGAEPLANPSLLPGAVFQPLQMQGDI